MPPWENAPPAAESHNTAADIGRFRPSARRNDERAPTQLASPEKGCIPGEAAPWQASRLRV